MTRTLGLTALVVATLALSGLAALAGSDTERRNAEKPSETWQVIRDDLYGDAKIADGTGMITLATPYRAHDAAVVPVALTVDPGAGRTVEELSIIIDENPVPLAATFHFEEEAAGRISLETRVRVNAYSNVRAIATLDDGSLYQVANFVKASGGCSAPATKDAEAAAANMGKMKVKEFAAADGSEVQVMVRHPNLTGFQQDQVTQLYIPAHYIDTIEVAEGAETVFRMTGGISLSEDPSIRFAYERKGTGPIVVRATDTEGAIYQRSFDLGSSS